MDGEEESGVAGSGGAGLRQGPNQGGRGGLG